MDSRQQLINFVEKLEFDKEKIESEFQYDNNRTEVYGRCIFTFKDFYIYIGYYLCLLNPEQNSVIGVEFLSQDGLRRTVLSNMTNSLEVFSKEFHDKVVNWGLSEVGLSDDEWFLEKINDEHSHSKISVTMLSI